MLLSSLWTASDLGWASFRRIAFCALQSSHSPLRLLILCSMGTIRESMCVCNVCPSKPLTSFFSDPLKTRSDAELLQILHYANLDEQNPKFDLGASVGNDGSGLSAGEKQQLALCRVLVKNSRIVVLVCRSTRVRPFHSLY